MLLSPKTYCSSLKAFGEGLKISTLLINNKFVTEPLDKEMLFDDYLENNIDPSQMTALFLIIITLEL